MPRFYIKIIKCVICGADREARGPAKYCLKHAKLVKEAQIRENLAGRPRIKMSKIKRSLTRKPKICIECKKEFIPVCNSKKTCKEACLYANNVKNYGKKKAANLASNRKSKEREKLRQELRPTKIEIPAQQLQGLSPEQISRYWGRIV